jgi:hypothetical protein
MRFLKWLPGIVLGLVWLAPPAPAQVPYRITEKEMKQLLERIDKGAETFRGDLKKALDRSELDDTRAEKEIKKLLADFTESTEKLKEKYGEKNSANSAVQEVLRRGDLLDRFMQGHRFSPVAETSWRSLRDKLDELARAYGVTQDWRTS